MASDPADSGPTSDGYDRRPEGRRRRSTLVLGLFGLILAFGVSEALDAHGSLGLSASSTDLSSSESQGPDPTAEPGGDEGSGNGSTGYGGGTSDNGSGGTGAGGNGLSDGESPNGDPDEDDQSPSPPPPPPPPAPPPPVGPILLTNDRGEALFTLANLGAGRPVSRCVMVTYRGSRPARVRLFASGSGTLAGYLQVVVKRGTAKSRAGRCTGFKPDARIYSRFGKGVLYRGRLADFPGSFEAAAPVTPMPRWRNGESHTYRIRVRIASANAAQGRSAGFDLVWQARP